MNTPSSIPPTTAPLTLESLARMKAEKLKEVRASKKRMSEQAQRLFIPSKTPSEESALMQSISSGIAIFDGVMTGIRIMRKIQRFFSKMR